jgi:hypothetical protein
MEAVGTVALGVGEGACVECGDPPRRTPVTGTARQVSFQSGGGGKLLP